MVGQIVLIPEKKARRQVQRTLAGPLPVLRAEVAAPPGLGERALRRRVRHAAACLERAGMARVLVPPNFPHWPELERRGLRPVDPLPLCQAAGAKLVLAALAGQACPPERAVVALEGLRVTRALFQCALALAPVVRCLVIAVPTGGCALARHLRQELGVAVVEAGTGLLPQVTAQFSPQMERGRGPTLRLAGPPLDFMGLTLSVPGLVPPQDTESLPFLAILWEMGRIDASQIVAEPAELT